MKHLEEFKLNENVVGLREENQQFNSIKELVISDLIQDFEFTDNLLDKPIVKERIDEYIQRILDNYLSMVKDLGEELETLTDFDGKTSTYDSRGGIYPR